MMPVFSGTEEKRLGAAQAHGWQKKAFSASLSFLSSAWFLFFPLSCLQRLIILPVPSPLYLSEENRNNWMAGWETDAVFFHLTSSSQPGLFLLLLFSYAASGLFTLLSAVICFYGGRERARDGKRVGMHRNYCISTAIMGGGSKNRVAYSGSFTSFIPRSLSATEMLKKLKSMTINCSPRR